jgi:hypothetical protein
MRRLRMFKNRALTRALGYKREEVAGGCRQLDNEKLHSLCSSSKIITIIMEDQMDRQA